MQKRRETGVRPAQEVSVCRARILESALFADLLGGSQIRGEFFTRNRIETGFWSRSPRDKMAFQDLRFVVLSVDSNSTRQFWGRAAKPLRWLWPGSAAQAWVLRTSRGFREQRQVSGFSLPVFAMWADDFSPARGTLTVSARPRSTAPRGQ